MSRGKKAKKDVKNDPDEGWEKRQETFATSLIKFRTIGKNELNPAPAASARPKDRKALVPNQRAASRGRVSGGLLTSAVDPGGRNLVDHNLENREPFAAR